MPHAEIGAVVFDIDHTLAFDNKLELVVLHEMAEELEQGVPELTKQQVLHHFDEEAHKNFEKVRKGEVKIERAMTDQFRSLTETLPHRELDPYELATKYIERVLARCEKQLQVVPGAKTLLDDLHKAQFALGILTNGWTRLQQRKAELVGFSGPVFISDDLGYWKPDQRAFKHVEGALKLETPRSVYVGDSPSSDIKGAKGSGWRAAWVNWEGEHFPEGIAPPDYELRSLDGLRRILL